MGSRGRTLPRGEDLPGRVWASGQPTWIEDFAREAGLARAVNDLATRARGKQLKADELSGGTFTVNNSGTFGTLFSYSVINPGQAGILTMEAIVERPVAIQGMIGIKPMMYLCFSFDHRVLDGLQAARFLTSCRKWLEAVTVESPVY